MYAGAEIIVESGGSLNIQSGKIYNATIIALPGSQVIIKNNAYVELAKRGMLEIKKGAKLNIVTSKVDVAH